MHRSQLSALLFPLLLAPTQGANTLRCENVLVDGHSFDLSSLGGPHSVVTSRYEPNPPEHFNTTYTLDICKPLKKSGKSKKGEECPNGTRVCGIRRLLKEDTNTVVDVFSIAGNLENVGGSQFEWEATRLKTSDSNSDHKKEGVLMVLKGGRHPLSGSNRREQKAIIEFLCDKDKKGDEGEWASEDKYERKLRARKDEGKENDKDGDEDKDKDKDKNEDGDGGDEGDDEGESTQEYQLKKEDSALIWESYKQEKDADVLRLTWHTKYACESRDTSDDEDGDGSTHWGFFTWFVIVVFLGIAAYLIFGSWLNYNRYGARGWDLVPHGDTIRDIPYLMKDWTRRVLNTVQGTGSRGGYSAV